MCGIVGNLSLNAQAYNQNREKWLKTALVYDSLRGMHSTGVMLRGKQDRALSYYKQAVTGGEFVGTEGYAKNVEHPLITSDVVVGHNRHATMGKINTENAHPFLHGDVMLVHNGTLHSMASLPQENKDIEIDSEMICYNLSLYDPRDADRVLNRLNGAFTLVWMDRRDDSLNIVRNTERPLHMCLNSSRNEMYFMSEAWMLAASLQRANIGYNDIVSLATHKWLKFTPENELKPVVKAIEPYRRSWSGTGHRGHGQWWPNYDDRDDNYNAVTRVTPTTTKQKKEDTPGPKGVTLVRKDGKRFELPRAFKESLGWYGLNEDREIYEFSPIVISKIRDGKAHVMGTVYIPEWDDEADCTLIMGHAHAINHESRNWFVRLVAVTYDKAGTLEFRAMFSCVKPLNDKKGSTDVVNMEEYKRRLKSPAPAGNSVKGPWGWMRPEAVEPYIKNGCSMCSKDILLEDCGSVEWVGELGSQPLCGDCAKDWR